MNSNKVQNVNWRMVKNAIQQKKAVLFLGPGISLNYQDSQNENSFLRGLSNEYSNDILSFHHDDGFLVFKDENAKLLYLHELREFYSRDFSNPLLDKIAEIPFHTIITVTPDLTLNKIFKQKGFSYEHDYYKPKIKKDLGETPDVNKPLIYNLLGCVKEDESLITSHYDLFNTIQAIYSDNNLPKKLTNLFNKNSTQNIIFLGFDFDKWYFQLILHLLQINFSPCIRYAAAERVLETPLQTLYESQFKIDFVSRNIYNFVNNLHEQFDADELRKPQKHQTRRIYLKSNILKLLLKSMNSVDFETFCMINYEDIYDDFTPEQGRTSRVNSLMEYLNRNDGFEELLDLLKEENLIQYKKNAPYYEED